MAKKLAKVAIGVDIGGTGIKGCPVNLKTGEFIGKRKRIPTPPNAAPEEIADIVKTIVDHFELPTDTPVGVTFPAPVVNGVVLNMANLSKDFIGMNVADLFSKVLERPVVVFNDADAAGFAEARYGAAHGRNGTIMVLTLGTGIGSALVRNGVLVPNTELGHILLDNGVSAENFAANSVREKLELSFEDWAERLQKVFTTVENLFSPDLFIIGGGISKKSDQFLPMITTRAPIAPAELLNTAGIVGAALSAAIIARGEITEE
ncbi:MAG: ROK family protein [Actinomycetaceae bacterium]|nr:ROK family protein [Actinomycetaceae bacterium]